MTVSPLVPRRQGGDGGSLPAPAVHTEAELRAMIDLLARQPFRVRTVVVGHGRDAASRETAAAFARQWSRLARDHAVLDVVDWPEQAASWLRPARRFADARPDAWVVAAAPLGWAQMARRLRHSTDWTPGRTFGFASLAWPHTLELAGREVLDELRGVTAQGGTWYVSDDELRVRPPDR